MTVENQTIETDLGSRLGHLSVIVSDLFLNQGSHSTGTVILHNIIYTTFSHGVDQYYSRAVSNIIDNNDIFSTVAATEVLDSTITKSCTS